MDPFGIRIEYLVTKIDLTGVDKGELDLPNKHGLFLSTVRQLGGFISHSFPQQSSFYYGQGPQREINTVDFIEQRLYFPF